MAHYFDVISFEIKQCMQNSLFSLDTVIFLLSKLP